MPSNRIGASLGSIRTLFTAGTVVGLADGQLLERFATADGEAAGVAFAALVERHGPMVLRVCRGVLRNAHDAEDAFQATFLILTQKAGSIRSGDSLASWLYGVAHNVASTARSAAARRCFHESKAGATRPQTTVQDARDDPGPVVHEELRRLPDRYRAAVVLCCLEGLTQQQAAEQLGWPLGTVQSRLARGRERLRARLARRGSPRHRCDECDLSRQGGQGGDARSPGQLGNPGGDAILGGRKGSQGGLGYCVGPGHEGLEGDADEQIEDDGNDNDRHRSIGQCCGARPGWGRRGKIPPRSARQTQPRDTKRPGAGVIAFPGPPPGQKFWLVFAVVPKLSNQLTLESGDQGRMRATLEHAAKDGKMIQDFKCVSIRIDASRQAADGPNSRGRSHRRGDRSWRRRRFSPGRGLASRCN